MRLTLSILAFMSVVTLSTRDGAAQEQTLKIASLAPEGSSWWKTLVGLDQLIQERTQGRIKLKIYAGGVAGDEPDVVRKMRVGSLHGGAITSVGLAEIQPALIALQAPGLFNDWDELDAARTAVTPRLNRLLADKGVVVLYWGDVGFARFFSQTPVNTPSDLKNRKVWCLPQDAVFAQYFKIAGVSCVPLGITDVLPSLQTGLVDTYLSAPLAAVSLQWFNKAKTMTERQTSAIIGALVLSNKAFERLSLADREVVMAAARELGPKAMQQVRADDQKSLQAIQKAGITITKADPKTQNQWDTLANQAADAAAGSAYPKDLLDEIRAAVAAHRAGKQPK